MKRLGWVFSLQTRLIAVSAAAVVLAVLVTGAVFVYRDREVQRSQQLREVASATRVFTQSSVAVNTVDLQPFSVGGSGAVKIEGGLGAGSGTLVKGTAAPEYRILLVDGQGQVVNDPAGLLRGTTVTLPAFDTTDARRGYVTWGGGTVEGQNVTFLAPTDFDLTAADGLTAIAAINTSSLTADWLATTPDLLLSALFGLPVTVAAVVLLTRRVTRPLRQLTLAADGMAHGDFDQRVAVQGRDEVATLATSFTAMAGRVKQRDSQLRDLIANVSHDLRTPLTSIQGYAEALADGVSGPDGVERMAGIIRDEARHASSLLANLLSLSEIESGEVVVSCETYDLVPVIERCVRRLSLRAAEGGIDVDVMLPASLPTVGDEEKTERALANVLENAVKFAAGSVRVVASREQGDVTVRIGNDGPGIEVEDAERIFDRFYRSPGPQSGTGLGLAIARQMMALQGGSLVLESAAPVRFLLSSRSASTGVGDFDSGIETPQITAAV